MTTYNILFTLPGSDKVYTATVPASDADEFIAVVTGHGGTASPVRSNN